MFLRDLSISSYAEPSSGMLDEHIFIVDVFDLCNLWRGKFGRLLIRGPGHTLQLDQLSSQFWKETQRMLKLNPAWCSVP